MYRGRFAPSPTGPLHLGSLVAALASFLDARAHGGLWHVRIEDLDPPRELAGAADDILRTLAALGLRWDGEVMYQSLRGEAYRAALEALSARGLVYPCRCSRREIADAGLAGVDGPVYPGTCRDRPMPATLPPGEAVRLRTTDETISFVDRLQGPVSQSLAREVGDFVLRRADGLWAYQLAVVVDDAEQGITEVVRGADLLASTPRQIALQRLLGLPTPAYAHVPLVVDAAGQKLAKQAGSMPVDAAHGSVALCAALRCLGLAPPAALERASPGEVLVWARAHWRLEAVPRRMAVPGP